MKAINACGKRKRSVAKVVLREGTGLIKINKFPADIYLTEIGRERINEVKVLAEDTIKKVNLDLNVTGGGWQSQVESSRLAIARALVKYDKKLRKTFNDFDKHLLVADVRRKEQRKPNDSKARARRQKSYR